MNPFDLSGVGVVVTGGANGIGAAATEAYLEAGARVAVLDLADDGKAPDGARYWPCDVADRTAVDAAFAAAEEWLGELQVLVNTAAYEAGPRRRVPSEDLTDDDLRRQLEVNLFGTVHTNQAAFRAMVRAGWGRIVNFTSSAGVRGNAMSAHYAASKGAIGAWTRSVAAEWAPHEICINAVAPAMATRRAESQRAAIAARSAEEAAEYDERLARLIPMRGKPGDPRQDLAPFLVFLASSGAGFITGQTFAVDGGMVMMSA